MQGNSEKVRKVVAESFLIFLKSEIARKKEKNIERRPLAPYALNNCDEFRLKKNGGGYECT